MWNFLATKGDRLHWYEHGAVPLAVDTFFDSEHQTSPIGFLNANHPLLELSIGVLVQFAEMESVKVQLCNNNRFMRRFCEVIADTRNLSSSNDEILYNGQLKLNTLMCLISSPSTHLQFLRRDILHILTQLSSFVMNNVASYYFFSLCVAFLFGFSLEDIRTNSKAHANCIKNRHNERLCEFSFLTSSVRNFLRNFKPSQQYKFEVVKQYLWITMKPYVELAWSNAIPPCQDTDPGPPIELDHGFHVEAAKAKYLPKIMGVWSLENMTRNKENVKIIYEEGLEDFVTMISWEFPQFKQRRAMNCVCEDNCNIIPGTQPHPPSLQNICRAKLMRLGGVTPQIGINGSMTDIFNSLRVMV